MEEMVTGAYEYASFINGMAIDKIITFDPHSRMLPEMIKNLTVIDSTRLVRQHVVGHADQGLPQRYQGIIAPDKGAVERAGKVADACHIPLYKAEKVRDKDTGKLSGFTCESLPDTGRFLVVDDICDGGGTFMGLAQAAGVGRDRLGLFVSHGVFSGNASHLWNHFSEIWTTDSLKTATNIDRPYFMGPTRSGKIGLQQYHELKANVIPLTKTLKGYNLNEH
jgi:ribose-phosphate pyrophosphokinase